MVTRGKPFPTYVGEQPPIGTPASNDQIVWRDASGNASASETSDALVSRLAGQQLIQSVTPTSGTSVTFSAIPQTFYDLEIKGTVIGTSTAGIIEMRFNADSEFNTNYFTAVLYHTSTPQVGRAANAWSFSIASISDLAGSTNAFQVMLPNYASTNGEKSIQGRYGTKSAHTEAGLSTRTWDGWWRSAAAITTITVFITGSPATFAAGTRISLYGCR